MKKLLLKDNFRETVVVGIRKKDWSVTFAAADKNSGLRSLYPIEDDYRIRLAAQSRIGALSFMQCLCLLTDKTFIIVDENENYITLVEKNYCRKMAITKHSAPDVTRIGY